MAYLSKLLDPAYYALQSSTDHDHPIGAQWKQLARRSPRGFYNFEHVVESEETFDVDSLFTVVGIMLKHSTPTNVDEVAQEKIDDATLEVDFNIPLGTLKEIGCELLCMDPDSDISNQKTRSILIKLSNYPWKAKAVLTVAAFGIKFGDAWLKLDNKLSESSDQLEKSKQEVTKLKNLINTTLQLIEIILDLEMPTFFSETLFQALTFWIIMTIIACASQVTIITSDNQDTPYDLYPYSQIIQFILSTLTEHLKAFGVPEKEEADQYLRLLEFLEHHNDPAEVFRALFSAGDYMPPLIYCPTKEEVAIDVLKGQDIRMLVSGLDISDKDITILNQHHEMMRTDDYDDQYKIVWVPIVEQWTDELDKEFSTLQSKMPCYSLKSSSLTTPGMKYIKHKWYYSAKPVIVWISRRQSLNERCVDLAKITNDFPPMFSAAVIGPMRKHMCVFRLEEKCTFFYGGKDKGWIKQFEKKASKMVDDPIIKSAKITIVLQYVQKSSSGGQSSNIMGSLMTAIQSLSSHKNSVPQAIMQRLNRFQDENVWAVLFKESSIVGEGHGDAIVRVLGDFDQWKQHVPEKGFKVTFNEYHATIINQRP